MSITVESKTHVSELPPIDTRPGQDSDSQVRVRVWPTDPITLTGLAETLMALDEVLVTSNDSATGVDVLVFATDRVTPEVLASMRRAAAESTVPMVLVTSDLNPSYLLSLVECRVVAVLHRTMATEERLLSAIKAAAKGAGALPPSLLGDLLRQVQGLQRNVLAPRGLSSVGLTPREIDVVRLIAEGCDTKEIGNRLCYSERTVKNIVQDMTNRLNVRNRPQLVAYGIRAGVI